MKKDITILSMYHFCCLTFNIYLPLGIDKDVLNNVKVGVSTIKYFSRFLRST